MSKDKKPSQEPTANDVKCWDSWGSTEVVTQRLKEMFVEMGQRSEEHTSELQSPDHIVCRLLLEKKKQATNHIPD